MYHKATSTGNKTLMEIAKKATQKCKYKQFTKSIQLKQITTRIVSILYKCSNTGIVPQET